MAPRMAFVGLDGKGHDMAASLCTQANIEGPLVVYHRITKTSEDFAFEHPNSRATPALTNLVRSADIIWTYLDHEMSINAVYQVLLASDVKGKLFVECSGVLEDDCIYALANEAKSRGAALLTLPFSADDTAGGAKQTMTHLDEEQIDLFKQQLSSICLQLRDAGLNSVRPY